MSTEGRTIEGREYDEAVHAVNADRFRPGNVFGWRDDRSEAKYLSGIVVATGPCVVHSGIVNWHGAG